MSIQHGYGVGLRNVGSYQVSGEPWVSGTTTQVASRVKRFIFPRVTREVSVYNIADGGTEADVRVHFASGSGHNFDTYGAVNTPGADLVTIDTDSNVYVGLHYVPVPAGSTLTFRVKCKEIYVATTSAGTATYRVMADLTNILTGSMYELTGSGHTAMTQE